MGCLRAVQIERFESIEPNENDGRFVMERRDASIGTPVFRSQCKRPARRVFAFRWGLGLPTVLAGAFASATVWAGSPSIYGVTSSAAALAAPSASSALPAPLQPGQTSPGLPAPPPPLGPLPAAAQPLPPPPVASPESTPSEALTGGGKRSVLRPGAPGSDLPAPPPPAPGRHFHDGFYLRLGLGLGLGGVLVSSDSKSVSDYSFGGGGGVLDLWLGGTPSRGLAMGGVFSALGISSAKRKVDGQRIAGDVTGSSALLGYFVDVFPDPAAGLHFGGALGVAGSTAEIKGGTKFDGGGLGLQAFAGYDFWVSPDWSLGGLARFAGSVSRDKQGPVNYEESLGAFTLSFTALYH